MKISLKPQDHHDHNHHPPLLLRAKIPISIFNLPFLSHFSTTTNHPSDLSLALSTNFPSFPSLKLSYAAASSSAATPPLSLTLKSGTGLFGSPNNSPLVISAHFSFNPANPSNPNPTFSLLLKPQLGSFSLRKSTFSHPKSSPGNADPNSFGFIPLERPETLKDLSIEKRGYDSMLKGFQLTATTQLPVAQKVGLDFRWGVNFAEDQMPILRINKIGLHRVDDHLKTDKEKKKKDEGNARGEVEVLKDMCVWMKRELDVLTRVNREMKFELEEARAGHFGFKEGLDKKKAMPSVGSPSGGFKQWKNTRNREGEERGNGRREEKKKGNDVENELQRAIEAANAAAA